MGGRNALAAKKTRLVRPPASGASRHPAARKAAMAQPGEAQPSHRIRLSKTTLTMYLSHRFAKGGGAKRDQERGWGRLSGRSWPSTDEGCKIGTPTAAHRPSGCGSATVTGRHRQCQSITHAAFLFCTLFLLRPVAQRRRWARHSSKTAGRSIEQLLHNRVGRLQVVQ